MKKKQFLKNKSFRFKRFEKKNYSAYNSMHKAVTIGVLSLAALVSTAPKTANAQVETQDTSAATKTLEEVSITDSPLEPINQTGKIVTVITRQEIENLHPASIDDLLKYVSGIDIQTRGNQGVQADISLRGGTFDQSAILLNGINITNPHTGHYSLDIPLNVEDIERVEIIRGPSAIVYGASAFSGGINIITKKNINKALSLKAEGGEHGYINSELSLAKKIKNIENYLSLGYKTSNGYTKNSAYDIYNILYQNRINLEYNNKIDFQVGYNNKDYDANTFYSAKFDNQHEKTSSFLTSVKGLFNIADNFKINASVYYNMHKDCFELIKDVSKPNYHKSNVFGNNMAFTYIYKNFKLNFGSDVRYEEILSSVLGEPVSLHGEHYDHYKDRTNFSYFVNAEYTYKNLLATLGVMTFQNSDIKQDIQNFYPSVNLNYSLNGSWQLYASFNSSSRLPTFTELYYKDAVHISNKDLKQEKSLSYEFGIKNLNHIAITNFDAYYMQGKNLIDWMKKSAEDVQWQSKNINSLDKYGFDVDMKIFLNEFVPFLDSKTTLNIGYSYLYQDKSKTNYISQYALNYLKHKFLARLSLPINKFTINLNGKYCYREGKYIQYNNGVAGQEVSYKPFFSMDANINYSFKLFDIYISATNLFNKEYYDIGNIIQPKRWVIGGIKLRL